MAVDFPGIVPLDRAGMVCCVCVCINALLSVLPMATPIVDVPVVSVCTIAPLFVCVCAIESLSIDGGSSSSSCGDEESGDSRWNWWVFRGLFEV